MFTGLHHPGGPGLAAAVAAAQPPPQPLPHASILSPTGPLLFGGNLLEQESLFGGRILAAAHHPLQTASPLLIGKRGWDEAFGGGAGGATNLLDYGLPAKRWIGPGGASPGGGGLNPAVAAAAAAAAALNGGNSSGGGGGVVGGAGHATTTTGGLVGGFNIGGSNNGMGARRAQ